MVAVAVPARRQMPLIDPEKRTRIFARVPVIRETILQNYHHDIFAVDLARAIARGNGEEVLGILENHPISHRELFHKNNRIKMESALLLQFVTELHRDGLDRIQADSVITADEISAYHQVQEEKLRAYGSRLALHFPRTLEMVRSSLEILPEVMTGQERRDAFASRIAWIGGEEEMAPRKTPRPRGVPTPRPLPSISTDPAKIVLVLSGGSAKGVFYVGFLRALQEQGIWPDFVSGSSAGALAGAALATGKGPEGLEKAFALPALQKIFSFWRAPLTLLRSFGSGFIGGGFARHLQRVFGSMHLSELADVFVIATIRQPVPFGKTVFGRASAVNAGVALSSDIQVWQALTGSSAMQGILPPAVLRDCRVERLVRADGTIKTEGIHLPYANLDDGAVVEYLPLATTDLLLEAMGENGLTIAVSLANLNPMRRSAPSYLSLTDRFQLERENFSLYPWYARPFLLASTFGAWCRQEARRRFRSIAPFRAFEAYEAIAEHSVTDAIASPSSHGHKILVNPNADGSLDGLDLSSIADAEWVKEYGYKTGLELVEILLGKEMTRLNSAPPK